MDHTVQSFAAKISHQYSKDVLYEILYLPIKKFLTDNMSSTLGGTRVLDIMTGLNVKSSFSKADLITLCSRFYTNPDILKHYVMSLPASFMDLLNKAIWVKYMDKKMLEDHFKRPVIRLITKETSRYHYYGAQDLQLIEELKPWAPFIRIHVQSWTHNTPGSLMDNAGVSLSLPSVIRDIFIDFVPKPEGYDLKQVFLPEKLNLRLFNVEKEIFAELPLIVTYALQNNIKYSQKGYPNLASARKFSTTLQLAEFNPGEDYALRGILIAGLLTEHFRPASVTASSIDTLKALVSTNFRKPTPKPYLLAFLKGVYSLNDHDFNFSAIENMMLIIDTALAGNDGWITFQNLLTYIDCRFLPVDPIGEYKLSKLSVASLNKRERDKEINAANYRNYVLQPFIAGNIYLLASLGLMELALEDNKIKTPNPYENLFAYRPTALGRYLFGHSKTYDLPERQQETSLLFDEGAPFIRIQGNIKLGDTMLAQFGVKVSDNRYQFAPGKFMKECKTKEDLEQKITLFQQTIGQKLPPFWDSYLKQLVKNTTDIEEEPDVRVYQLAAHNKDLIRIVAQDEVLKKIVIKAEFFTIMVPENKTNLFIQRMKELGYLVTS